MSNPNIMPDYTELNFTTYATEYHCITQSAYDELVGILHTIRHSKPTWKRDGTVFEHPTMGKCSLTFLMQKSLDILHTDKKDGGK
jgi:hypothetical protein